MSEKIDEETILMNIENSVLSTFSYPKSILGKIEDKFGEFEKGISKSYNTDLFIQIYQRFVEKCKNEFMSESKRSRIIQIFIRSIREILSENKIKGRGKLKFTLPTKEEEIYIGRREYIHWHYGKRYEDVYKRYVIFDVNIIRTAKEYTIGQNTYETQNIVNIFNIVFKTKSLDKNTTADLLSKLNKLLKFSFDTLVSFFIEDISHSEHLDEVIDFQNRISKILNKIKSVGSLDTTREIADALLTLLNTIGFKDEDITLDFNGKKIKNTEIEEPWAYPTGIFVDLTKKTINGVPKDVINIIKQHLENGSQIHNFKLEDKGQGLFELKRTTQWKTKKELKDFISMIFNIEYKINISLTPLSISSKASLDNNTFMDFTSNKTIQIRNIEQLFSIIEKKLTKRIFIETNSQGKKVYEELSIITCYFTRDGLEIRIFDLIEYFQELANDIHKFFAETMNLKAITQKKKISERWDGSRGVLDVERSINSSINQGIIYPMQTFRRRLIKSPPTIFMVYDISESMKLVHRLAQFLIIIVLSFFEKDINKFFTGYITTFERGSGFNTLFRSEMEDIESSEQKRIAYEVGKTEKEAEPYYFLQEQTELILIPSLGEIANDYYDYDTAIRDFLDNSRYRSGTRFDIYNLVPYHPDIDARGLKYVLVITDAAMGTSDLIDFVSVSRELVDRDDVRFFFLWIVQEDERADTSDDSNFHNSMDTSRHFITKQQLMRKIDSLSRTKAGKMKEKDKIDVSDMAWINFYLFVYNHWDKCHIVSAENLQFVGEIKDVMNKLAEQDFFIP
ncbi:MAG: hypothetical protein ACFFDB_00300 [Promethearchaeota archaeon]